MYAEYWKPMYWNSRIERNSGNTVVEKMFDRKLWLGPPRTPPLTPEAAICAEVTPPV